MVVVADTSPLRYLILIEHAAVLPAVLGTILCPAAVLTELAHPHAPVAVRAWALAPPTWVRVHSETRTVDLPARLGAGESAAIALACDLRADAVLVDDGAARQAARHVNLTVIGTLAVLARAADAGLLELDDALSRLARTNFRATPGLLERLRTAPRRRS